jgi:alpha-glucosidase
MPLARRIHIVLVGCLLLSLPLWGDWASLGPMPPARQTDQGVEYRNAQGIVQVVVLRPGIIRVRFTHKSEFGRDESYAVLPEMLRASSGRTGAAPFQLISNGPRDRLQTSDLAVEIRRDPFRLRFLDAKSNVLDQDTDGMGMAYDPDGRVRVWKVLNDDDHFFGFGEKTGPLDKRGLKLGGADMAMWNSDVYGYDNSVDPLYADIPFFLTIRKGVAHGTFFDNTWRTSFDVGHQSLKYLQFGAEGGELNYYILAGPTPAEVLRRYRELTGPVPLPPLWALGYHQCRYSYYPAARVMEIARNFRERHIPADVIWFDIHYMDGYRLFTWDPKRFPDPRQLMGDLARMDFKAVAIVDPGVKVDSSYAVYQSGLRDDIFVKYPNGKVYSGPVWPGEAAFPDFTDAKPRQWWSRQIHDFAAVGLAGIWNDMNEPAVFEVASGTMPDEVVFHHDGAAVAHAEVHNVYGQQMSRATQEGLLQLRPAERPFVLTRATYAGGQRYAALWTGDNTADWSHLRDGMATLLGLGISGFPFVGNDIGGFAGRGDAELWTRWVQAGTFFPFMRAHAELSAPNKEPWAYGPEYEAYNRHAIERRYEFLPYIYNCFYQTSQTGLPVMRALMLGYPDDPATYSITNEYLFGPDLLAAPVLSPQTKSREVYFPRGIWYGIPGDRTYEGGRSVSVNAGIDELPMFVPEGAVLFRAPVLQSTGEWPTAELTFEIFAHRATEREYYEDDGASFDYRQDGFFKRQISFVPAAGGATVTLGAAEGSFAPKHRANVVLLHFARQPRAVRLDGEPLSAGAVRFDSKLGTLALRIPQSRSRQTLAVEW